MQLLYRYRKCENRSVSRLQIRCGARQNVTSFQHRCNILPINTIKSSSLGGREKWRTMSEHPRRRLLRGAWPRTRQVCLHAHMRVSSQLNCPAGPQIRIVASSSLKSYISYALKLFQEKGHATVVLKAMGRAINKAVAIGKATRSDEGPFLPPRCAPHSLYCLPFAQPR